MLQEEALRSFALYDPYHTNTTHAKHKLGHKLGHT